MFFLCKKGSTCSIEVKPDPQDASIPVLEFCGQTDLQRIESRSALAMHTVELEISKNFGLLMAVFATLLTHFFAWGE